MEIYKTVCIHSNQTMQWCSYILDWNNMPVYITSNGTDSRSALYKDGTSFFIINGNLIKIKNDGFILNRLWHEVAHLFFQDVWKPWDIRYEYRADLIASAASSRNLTLSRLYALQKMTTEQASLQTISKRIKNLYSTPNTYTKATALYMFNSLKPVTILK